MRIEDIKKLPKKDLAAKIDDLKKELLRYKSQSATGTMPENPGRIKEIKRTIARVKTLESQKEVRLNK